METFIVNNGHFENCDHRVYYDKIFVSFVF